MTPSSASSDVRRVVASTADAAFAVDSNGYIVAWNRAAERLLGVAEPDAVGQRCSATVRGRDVFGNSYCSRSCPVLAMARRSEPVGGFRLLLSSGAEGDVQVDVTVVVLGSGRDAAAVHVVRCADRWPRLPPPGGDGLSALTPREAQVLRLLEVGRSTVEIADLLFISPHTVRSHVKSLTRKLRVHSRLEAVCVAREGAAFPQEG